jgi:hypothetical protein
MRFHWFIPIKRSRLDWRAAPPTSYSETDHRGLTAFAMMRALHGRWLIEKGLLHLKE